MFEGYRVVVVSPAGRQHVADLMRRHVEAARPLVDEMHLVAQHRQSARPGLHAGPGLGGS